jgi:hypothetical protein
MFYMPALLVLIGIGYAEPVAKAASFRVPGRHRDGAAGNIETIVDI